MLKEKPDNLLDDFLCDFIDVGCHLGPILLQGLTLNLNLTKMDKYFHPTLFGHIITYPYWD